MLQTNLYDSQIYFALQHKNNITLILEPKSYILEPMNWDGMINNIPRSAEWYGFWTDFLEDKYGLTFTFIKDNHLTGGGQFLKDIYEEFGDQAEVYFSIGYSNIYGVPYKEIKSWRVNLQEYELLDGSVTSPFGGVMASIEKMPFQGKLKARMDAQCTINQPLNMDGWPLTQISAWTMRLHSKALLQQSTAFTNVPITSEELPATFFDSYLIFQPDQNNFSINELSQVFSQPCGFLDTTSQNPAAAGTPAPPSGSGLDALPFTDFISQFSAVNSGTCSISWLGGGPNTAFYYFKTSSTNNYWEVTPRVVVQRLIAGTWQVVGQYLGTTKTISVFADTGVNPTAPMVGVTTSIATAGLAYILPSVTGAVPRSNVKKVSGFTIDENFTNIDVVAGDNIYVHLLWCPNGTVKIPQPGWIQVDGFFNTITYKQETVTLPSTATGYRAFDILTQMIENMTGQKNALISPYFSEGGDGYKRLYTNGYSLRNFNALINQPKKSFKSFVSDEQSTNCLGMGVSEIEGKEYVIIDYVENFFRRRTIMRFSDTLEFKDKHNPQYIFNKIRLGYNKWQGLDLKMMDEYNTQGEYLIQYLKYGESSLDKMSDTIASGYIIEEQRRNQFNFNSQQSLQEDESMFVVCTNEPNAFQCLVVNFGASTSRVQFYNTSMALGQGDTFSYYTRVWSSGMILKWGEVVYYSPTATRYKCNNPSGAYKSVLAPPADFPNMITGPTLGDNQGTLFTVVSQDFGTGTTGQSTYNITPAPLDELFSGYAFTIRPASPDQVFAERDQNLEICSGVQDPSTVYNPRLSLKHILYNWRPIISVTFYFNQGYASSYINTQLAKMNSNFTTKYNVFANNKGSVGDLTINEFENEPTQKYLSNGGALFSPVSSELKVKIGWNQMDILRKALAGELQDATKDFGGIEARDSAGDWWFCHVMGVRFNIVTQILSLSVQKVEKLT